MRELRLRLETVTPMFLGGANPRGAPELRPPSPIKEVIVLVAGVGAARGVKSAKQAKELANEL